jgi:MFS family permease
VRPPLIVLLCAYTFAVTVSQGAFPALLPDIGTGLRLADWQLGIVASAFGFARLASDLPIGLVITRHLRAVLVAGPVVVALGVLAVASGGPFGLLVAGRVVMGVGHGLAVVGGLTAILRFRAPHVLASSLNGLELTAMLGILTGTVVLGWLPARLPWNLAFLVTCAPQIFGLLTLPALLAALPRERAVDARPADGRPTAPSGPRRPGPRVALAFAAGAAVAITYATLEHFVIPLRASRELGLDRSGIAGLLMVVQLCDIACLLPVGALGDRLGTARVLGLLLLVFAAATALIGFGGLPLLVTGCALFGIGMAGWTLPLALLRRATPPERIGWRTAVYRVGVDGGMFLGPFLSGLLVSVAPWLLPGVGVVALAAIGLALLGARASKGASTAPSEPPPGSDCAGEAGARTVVTPTRR